MTTSTISATISLDTDTVVSVSMLTHVALAWVDTHRGSIRMMNNPLIEQIGESVVDLGDLMIAHDPLTDKCIRETSVTLQDTVEQHWTINHNLQPLPIFT